MGFGSTFQTMMPQPSLSSRLREITGKDVEFVAFALKKSALANLLFLSCDQVC
jgi:hypothetical protein